MEFTITPEIVIGLFLILWGSAIIVKMVWGIEIPIIKPFLALFLIFLGLSMLFGSKTYFFCQRSSFSTFEHDDKQKD